MRKRFNATSRTTSWHLWKVRDIFLTNRKLYPLVHLSSRYTDDIFMTTNQIIEEINVVLDRATNKDINIKIESVISMSVHFLDVTTTNDNGRLKTSIYHKSTTDPYILPYRSDHPRHIYQNIPYATLLRAARIYSYVNEFDSERVRIGMSLLLNNYPPNFISKQFSRFFQLNNAMSLVTELNEQVCRRLHQTLLYQPTRREQQLSNMMTDPVKTPFVLQPKIWNKELMYPHYLFDTGLTIQFPGKFYTWWKKYYALPGSSLENVKVRLVAKTGCTLESFFIHKKPSRDMLTKIEET